MVTPASGAAASTVFTASVAAAAPSLRAGSAPLGQRAAAYEFSYRIVGANGSAVANGASGILRPFSPVPSASFALPAAGGAGPVDVEVSVRAMSADGTLSATASVARVAVSPPALLFDPAPDGSLPASFDAAAAAAVGAAAQGRADEAVARIGALASALRDAAASASALPPGQAAIAAERLLRALAQAAPVALPTPAATDAVASTLAAITAAPGLLTSSAQNLTVSLAASAAGGPAPLSRAAAQSLLAALSAAAAGQPALAAAAFAAADAVAQRLLDGLLPGEAPALLSSPLLAVAARVDSPAASPAPRVSAQRLAAPADWGGPSFGPSFGPIPLSALSANLTAAAAPSAARQPPQALLRSLLLAALFDPHLGTADPVARFTLETGSRQPVAVAPGQAIEFSLPSPDVSSSPAPPGSFSTCTFWCVASSTPLTVTRGALRSVRRFSSPPRPPLTKHRRRALPTHRRDSAAGAFSAQGCAALPNPRPAALDLTWLPLPQPGFPASSSPPPSLSAGWAASGPLMASSGGPCNLTVLDCTQPGARVALDPRRPISVESVACPASGGASSPRGGRQFVLFYGAGCPLLDRGAPCFWRAAAALPLFPHPVLPT